MSIFSSLFNQWATIKSSWETTGKLKLFSYNPFLVWTPFLNKLLKYVRYYKLG